MMKLIEAMDIVYRLANKETDVVFGTSCDENISENYVKVTVFFKLSTKTC